MCRTRTKTSLKRLAITGAHEFFFYDLSPLNTLPLEELTCEEHLVRWNRDVLREMGTLKTVNGEAAAQVLALPEWAKEQGDQRRAVGEY